MPLIKCMYHNDDGSVYDAELGGCNKPDCLFVHPGDPKWKDARTPRNRPRRFGFGGPQRTASNDTALGRRPSGGPSGRWGAPRNSGSFNERPGRSRPDDAFASEGFSQIDNDRDRRNNSNNSGWGWNSNTPSTSNWNASATDTTANSNTTWETSGWDAVPTDGVGWDAPASTTSNTWKSSEPGRSGSGSGSVPTNADSLAWGSGSTTSANTGWTSPAPVAAPTKPDQSAAWSGSPETPTWNVKPQTSVSAWGSKVVDPSPSRRSPRIHERPPQSPPRREPSPIEADPPQAAWTSLDPMENEDRMDMGTEVNALPSVLFDYISEDSEAAVAGMLEFSPSARPMSPSAQSDASLDSCEHNDSRIRWRTYLSVIARAVRRYERLCDLEKKCDTNRNISNSKIYKPIEEGSKAHSMLVKLRQHEEGKLAAAKRQLDETLEELVNLEFPTAGGGLSEEDYLHAQETEKTVREMAEWVEFVRPIVQDLKSSRVPGSLSDNVPGPSSAAGTTSTSDDAVAQLKAKVSRLEAKLDDLEEYFHSAVFDVKDEEYHQMISDRVEEAAALVNKAEDLDSAAQAVLTVEQKITPVLEEQEGKVKEFDAQLAKIRQDLGGRPRLDKLQEEQAKLHQSNHELRQLISANSKEYSYLISKVDSQSAEITALRAQLTELESSPPPPPPPTLEYMAECLMPSILQMCQPEIADALKQMHEGVQTTLNELQAGLVGQVYKGLMPVVNLTDRLQTFVENESTLDRARSQPVAGPSSATTSAPPTAAPQGFHPSSSAPPS